MPRLIDLSHPVDPTTPIYPGDAPVGITVVDSTDQSTPSERHLNSSRVAFGLHCGTHMDAPLHFYGGAASIDQAPLARCVGPCLLLDVQHKQPRESITLSDLAPHRERLRQLRKVVLHTGWSKYWATPAYFVDHPVIDGAAAKLLVEFGVELVGVDMPSVDQPPFDAHLELLGRAVLIVENLTHLDAIGTNEFQISVLPLKLEGREASPVRAVAIVG